VSFNFTFSVDVLKKCLKHLLQYNLAYQKERNIGRLVVAYQMFPMRNLIIDGAAGGETKIRHDVTFPLLTLHRGKDRVQTKASGLKQR
jgi:hypothetical protein